MITKRATLKELQELNEFKGVNRKGVTAVFTVKGNEAEAMFEDGTTKTMKLDSVRRSWMIIQEEENNEEEEQMKLFVPGVKVKDSVTGKVGVVKEVIGKLATVENEQEDFAANTDNLSAIGSEEVKPVKVVKLEKPKAKKEELKKEDTKKEQTKKEEKQDEFKSPEEVARNMVHGDSAFKLLNYETAMARKHMKSITDIAMDGHMMRIRQNGSYIMAVTIFDAQGEVVYDSPKMSVKDALDHLGYTGDHLKNARRQITQIRKQARQQA